jgi:UDP-N-acetylglucosamine acyltransferase
MDNVVDIHPTAVVHPNAKLAEGVTVGPYAVVGEHVAIGAGTKLFSHVVIDGHTQIGERNQIYPGAVIGMIPQDLKFGGETTWVRIGDDNTIREYATIHLGTNDTLETRIGNRNLLMAYVHVAHDCQIGNDTVIANATTMGGHCKVEDKAIVGGMTGMHQFTRVGQLSIIGGYSKVVKDVPPFFMADGHPAKVHGINRIGLERAGVPSERRDILKKAYRFFYRSDLNTREALKKISQELDSTPEIAHLVKFYQESGRGVIKSSSE